MISQVEVFEDELAIATGHWRAARAAGKIVVAGLRAAFGLDQLIKGLAVRIGEERNWYAIKYAPRRTWRLIDRVIKIQLNELLATNVIGLSL